MGDIFSSSQPASHSIIVSGITGSDVIIIIVYRNILNTITTQFKINFARLNI